MKELENIHLIFYILVSSAQLFKIHYIVTCIVIAMLYYMFSEFEKWVASVEFQKLFTQIWIYIDFWEEREKEKKDLSEEEEEEVKWEIDRFVKERKLELGITIGLGVLNYLAVTLCFLQGWH